MRTLIFFLAIIAPVACQALQPVTWINCYNQQTEQQQMFRCCVCPVGWLPV